MFLVSLKITSAITSLITPVSRLASATSHAAFARVGSSRPDFCCVMMERKSSYSSFMAVSFVCVRLSMATPSNIDVFNETVGKTFAFLYESFPRKVTIDVCALTGVSAPTFEEKDPAVRKQKHEALVLRYYSIEWLIAAGYVSADAVPFESFDKAVLTAKGLELLKLDPESLKQSLGDKLVDATKSGAIDAIKSTASSALTTGISFAFKHLFG